MRFRYRAATPDGQVVEGVVQAPSSRDATEELRRQRLVPVAVEPEGGGERAAAGERMRRTAAVALWTRALATLLEAGIPLDRALGLTAEQAGHPGVAEAARQTRRAVQGGATLADALGRHPRVFSPFYVSMIAAGEAGGALDQAAARLADHLEEANDLAAQVRSALLYPAIMGLAAGVGVTVLLVAVVPRFARMLQDVGGRLPMSTRALLAASHVVLDWWWVWVPLLAVAAVGVRAWLARPANRARWHAARLGLPLVGPLERKFTAARFARTLGLLLRGGMAIIPALRIARTTVANLALGAAVERAVGDVGQGRRLAASLAGTLPPLATQLLAAGEEGGKLEDMCLRVADTYDREVRRSLRTLVGLIEPALIVVFGIVVGFVALAMLQAIYSVNASVF